MLKKLFLTFLESTKRKSKSTLAITMFSSYISAVSPTSSSIHLHSRTSSFSWGSQIYKKTLQPIFFRPNPSLYPGPHKPQTSLSLSSQSSCQTAPENGSQTKLGNESPISTSPDTTGNNFQGHIEDQKDAEPHKDSRTPLSSAGPTPLWRKSTHTLSNPELRSSYKIQKWGTGVHELL